ncbi:hypothetical protein ANCDUO_17865, partial [Ancylostoma duodenale]
QPPRGVICDGWKEDKIPLNVTDPFSAVVQYVDEKKVQTESTLFYSPAEQMVVVSGARRGDVVPFINEQGVPAEASSVVHDFSKGYEYALDSTRCVRLSALPNNTADVFSSPEGALALGPVEHLLFASDLKFGHYGQLPAASGRMMDMYRAVDSKTNDVVEALFDGNKLASYATYKEEVSSSALLEKLNTTISQGDWKFSVPTADKKQEEWIVAAKSLSRYAPPAPSGSTYSGYTGGAMFVLGIFALLLGVAIGAGSVFFITKRQRISTLAYQVFE